jgi:hypothetical protein
MTVYEFDPTKDERWEDLLREHPQACVFHTSEWLEALRRTYNFAPIAITTSPPGIPLANGLPLCQIRSWLSGHRLVSLPFSDHCQPLVGSSDELHYLLTYLRNKRNSERWNYIEIRPTDPVLADGAGFKKSQVFLYHKLDLRRSLNDIVQNLHKNCVKRKLQRAEREGVVCESGRANSLLTKFYNLLLTTRRRHGLPAQPINWFQNLIACLGERVKIWVASKDGRAIAGILTLCYKQVLVYKYGCSDHRFNNLGGTQLLLWRAIEEAKEGRLSEFDLGRSDYDNPGLVAFKDRWGANRTELTYFRYPRRHFDQATKAGRILISKHVWSHVPTSVLAAAGRALYKHMG